MADDDAPETGSGAWLAARRAGRWAARVLLVLVLLFAAVVVFLHTPPGRQFIVDRIAKYAPASGLSVTVGRVGGSVLWNATFYDVKFRDADGTLFLSVPEIELNWRPYKFPFTGLDVRNLALHEGTLYARPDLKPGDPNAPILPDFDIRVDRLLVDDLHVAKGLLGEERAIDFRAKADVRKGKVLLDADGELGGGDVLALLVDAEPDGDRFDLDLDYRAPAGGLLASLVGATDTLRLKLAGDGTWTQWNGKFTGRQGKVQLADLKVENRGGRYTVAGVVRPDGYVSGLRARALGTAPRVAVVGTLKDSVATGAAVVRGGGIDFGAKGAVDLADNAFDRVELTATARDPALLGKGTRLEGARLSAQLDGPFRTLTVPHELTVATADFSGTRLSGLEQRGTMRFADGKLDLPLDAKVARVTSGNSVIDPRLVGGTLRGDIALKGSDLGSDNLRLVFPGLDVRLTLRGDTARGVYALAGPVEIRGLPLDNVGTMDAGAKILFKTGTGVPWTLTANFTGRLAKVSNATIANVAGDNIRFGGGVTLGAGRPIAFSKTRLQASKLTLALDGRVEGGRTTLAGTGRQADYGEFTFQAAIAGDGPRATLVFASPLPSAGLKDVHVALAPNDDGFDIDTNGQSLLGPFDGALRIAMPAGAPVTIAVDRFHVSDTDVTGQLAIANGAATGSLTLEHGGVDGTVDLAPRGGGQGFDVRLVANDASFGGATPLTVRRANLTATGTVGGGKTTISGEARAQGISYGQLFVGRFSGKADVVDGVGKFDAALSGRRGSGFDLQLTGSANADQVALAAKGSYGSRKIAMPRRAILAKLPDGGWELRPTQLDFGEGRAIAEGRFGGGRPASGKFSLDKMPLSLIDVVGGDVGLGGTISGIVDLAGGANGDPTGEARVMARGLTRSGLVLTSRPIDLALVARLSPTLLQARAVLQDDGGVKGRLQGRISMGAPGAPLFDRLEDGNLQAQLRYDGPADALWRLAALDFLDLHGPIRVSADARGTLRNPDVSGTIAGDTLRAQSALTGTDLKQVKARGRFAGSRLQLTSLSGNDPNGGTVTGSGVIDLSNIGPGQGPSIDLRLAASNARVLDLPTMGATVTGPIRIVSTGVGGTIAGRLKVNKARWRLGAAAASEELPNIRTRKINMPADVAPPRAPGAPWRFLIDASAPNQVKVDGMGLDSEWRANIRLRGTTSDPRIGGTATIVPRQGFYTFAGTRFDITRGIIDFDENVPPDPRIDLVAETEANGTSVAVNVGGRATQPEVTFSSSPSLPEEEILARLLFGGSISNLSATDALQLGAALASLRGGSGIDPINKLRQAVGLDRLRIVPADPSLDRGTALALGKRFGRKFYAEIITDGRGYTATEVEFRITSWLALLGTVSSLGRESASVEVSKDY
ncbi:DUF490 domain-containing protein [Altererythrobacter salegens]|uniref:DUF490 domain-containing protein n=1 Tax=Croceibacterium salegens TaxID=1737568 RepID=A0A6I4ST34_9SPHN|nr:translocation/assembly module TamB domain-containing protein [Croceibacterium salegens]MXO58056.1 DUF490 domain-containing protein [Croceibacterium salegens]